MSYSIKIELAKAREHAQAILKLIDDFGNVCDGSTSLSNAWDILNDITTHAQAIREYSVDV